MEPSRRADSPFLMKRPVAFVEDRRRSASRPSLIAHRHCATAVVLLIACWTSSPTSARSDIVPSAPPSAPVPREPNEATLLEHGHYVNRDGHLVHAPAHTKDDGRPDGASARCRDGTYSFSQHRRGTCSHHGGVASWF